MRLVGYYTIINEYTDIIDIKFRALFQLQMSECVNTPTSTNLLYFITIIVTLHLCVADKRFPMK